MARVAKGKSESRMSAKSSSQSKYDIVLAGGRVIDPSIGFSQTAHVCITDKSIAALEPASGKKGGAIPSAKKVIDVSGKIVTPGLIDCHVHLREPGREGAETIESGCRAAAAGGFTTVMCMPNTTPRIDNQETVRFVREQARHADARVYVVGAITKGLEGKELAEIGDLVKMGAVAITDDGHYVQNPEIMRRALEYSKMFNIPVMDHCEDQYLVGNGVMNESYESTRLGLKGSPSVAEELAVIRDIALCRLTNAKLHVQHITTRRAIEAVRMAKKEGIKVTTEACPHHFVLTDEEIGKTFNTALKVNPPLRSRDDVDAVIAGLIDGTIECIASDHAPHTDESKDGEYDQAPSGMIGLETTVALVKTYLIDKGILDWADAIQKMTTNPARIFNLPGGTLGIGKDADITVIDPDKKWIVQADKFRSRSKNSPFIGYKLSGQVTMTILRGGVVFQL
jgi:dihydroorotase